MDIQYGIENEDDFIIVDKIDIIGLLVDRGLIHITDKILKNLGFASLINIRLVNHLYKDLVEESRVARAEVRNELSWLEKSPTVRLVSENQGHMITCMATDETTIVYSLLGQDATLNIHNKTDLSLTGKLVQEPHFPASISSMDCNSTMLVTCAYEEHTRAGMQYAVHLWMRKRKEMTAKFRPHSDIIRAVKLSDNKMVVTASNDGTIAITSIVDPWNPVLINRLLGHTDIICSMDMEMHRVVSVSTNLELRVWSLTKMSCSSVIAIKTPTLRVALKWPLAASGGQSTVILWNLLDQSCIRTLAGPVSGILNVLSMDQEHLVMGDHRGRIAIWSISKIIEGHVGDHPHRLLYVSSKEQEGEDMTGQDLLSALKVEKKRIITGGWAGKCLSWEFS